MNRPGFTVSFCCHLVRMDGNEIVGPVSMTVFFFSLSLRGLFLFDFANDRPGFPVRLIEELFLP